MGPTAPSGILHRAGSLTDRLQITVLGGQYNSRTANQFVPLGRNAEAIEVANMALCLASDESSYCNACAFVVDGA